MKFYQETTKWPDPFGNGIYLLDDTKTKMYAYIKPGSTEIKQFKNAIRIDTRGRQFKILPNQPNFKIAEPENPNRWEVTGSKGDIYIVTLEEGSYTCSCSGFRYRGECKHIKEFQA